MIPASFEQIYDFANVWDPYIIRSLRTRFNYPQRRLVTLDTLIGLYMLNKERYDMMLLLHML